MHTEGVTNKGLEAAVKYSKLILDHFVHYESPLTCHLSRIQGHPAWGCSPASGTHSAQEACPALEMDEQKAMCTVQQDASFKGPLPSRDLALEAGSSRVTRDPIFVLPFPLGRGSHLFLYIHVILQIQSQGPFRKTVGLSLIHLLFFNSAFSR